MMYHMRTDPSNRQGPIPPIDQVRVIPQAQHVPCLTAGRNVDPC
eukprot:CAMPEP_0183440526 /NCGR_PEP_ID=MMETSP0370-20130417/81804_1 /TAXON_ID=268820 /ORGANISM="Peridinium aciculiferum, Strain PAER-2" /LENGTH=43 /DNA_ID= /DNA_START= /DNA_END= /DNA_ORIENTATION=